jgi:nucleoside-diphosphate kinase
MSRTLAIIKPDAVASGKTGKILAHIQGAGFQVLAMRMTRLSTAQAQAFYEVHRERPFYDSLVSFMTSGPCVPIALAGHDAVAAFRRTIGATNPAEAEDGTVRKLYAESLERNAVHGSDSDENAAREIGFFFSDSDLIGITG